MSTSHPDRWVGHGTPRSCTSRAVVRAVAKGGVIRFRCGPGKVKIVMQETAKVVNTSRRVVLDGRGKVTLSGGGKRRILYQDTCDKRQVWTTSHCDDQATPRLVVQNLTFANGNSTGETYEGGGGGAIFVRGGRLKIVALAVHRQPLRPDRPGPGRRRRAGAVAVPRPTGLRDPQHVHPRGLQQRRRRSAASACRGRSSTASSRSNRAIGRGANPAGSGHARRRLRRRDLHGRQRLPRADRRHAHDPQPRERGRRRDLLRQQRPHRRRSTSAPRR